MLLPNQTLSKNITYYRNARKLSRAKLATIVGMDPNHLYRIEAGLKYPKI